MSARNEWRVPDRYIEKWLKDDKTCALSLYGASPLAKPHQLPCIATAAQVRKGTRCIVIVLGASRNKQPTLVIDGPDGSDLPNGKSGDDFSVGRVYTATSSAATRASGDSNKNGWMMKVQNSIEMELQLTRPVDNGAGLAGVTSERLNWFAEFCESVRVAALECPWNEALRALESARVNALAAVAHCDIPLEFWDAEDGYRLWKGFSSLARPNKDKKVRARTANFPRQVKKSQRAREKRLAVGTTISPSVKMSGYEGAVKIDGANGCVSVMARADTGRRMKTWVPLTLVCEQYREQLLTSCIRDVLTSLVTR